ncbi:MAG: helix-turn-helix domain-containing protein [Treponema sp.]|nr:helix-turn-helix domain-containing protein [Treponema sp.]
MESLGVKLKAAREEKNLNLDQVGRETNISVRYLTALETENFSDFPGEPYITGFLRNYGTYLDLDVQELLSLYRALRIQEQPVPVEQLLKPRSNLPKILIILAGSLAVLGVVGGVLFYLITRPKKPVEVQAERIPVEYVMDGSSLERRLFRGDTVLVSAEGSQYKFELAGLGEAATIGTPVGSVILDLGQEGKVALGDDGFANLTITIIDFVKNNPGIGVLLRLDMESAFASGEYALDDEMIPVEAVSAVGNANSRIVFSSPNAYPFTLQASFQGYCMFRWEILFERDRRDRNERYFQRTDELNIQAQNGIRIWTSNAQAARFQVIGGGQTYPLELGAPGEVVVADLRWLRNEDNRYSLALVRLEAGN